MKNTSLNDILYRKNQFKNSPDFLKSPIKTQKTLFRAFNPQLNNQKTKSSSKNQINVNNNESKIQIDQWMIRKQKQIRESVNRTKKHEEQMTDQIRSSDKIHLKKRQEAVQNSKIKQKTSRQTICRSKNSKQTKTSINQSFAKSLTTLLNRKQQNKQRQQYFKNVDPQEREKPNFFNHLKLSQRINALSMFSKSKQFKTNNNPKWTDIKISTTKQICEKKCQTNEIASFCQSSNQLSFFQADNHKKGLNQDYIVNKTFINKYKVKDSTKSSTSIKQRLSLSPRKLDQSIASVRFNSPIYQNPLKRYQLIVKYSPRELSPKQKQQLRHKYFKLQKKLDNILRSVRTQKQYC